MPENLSPADRASLTGERGHVNMTVGGVLVLERGPGVTAEALTRRIEERVHLIPRYRQRIEEPPLGVANPVWVDDEHFDAGWHVEAATLAAPGGDAELAAYVGREFSRRLDRSRPLWELHVVHGLAGDRVAVIPKMHHALVDGMAAVGVGMVLLDPGPEPLPVEPPEDEWRPRPYALRRHLTRLATQPITQAQRLALEQAKRVLDPNPLAAAGDLRRAAELVGELARTRPQAPDTPLNAPITANRSFALARAPLAGIKAAARAAGGTVNDAILAAVAGMLRRYLDEAGTDLRGRSPVALVPVSVRREDEADVGNRLSTVFVDLPVAEDDPYDRIRAIAEQTSRIKGSAQVRAGAVLVGMTGFAPPAISSVLVRAVGGVRAFNLVVSNVPGPQQPFYLNGSRVLECYPVVPLNPAHQRLTVGILSYDGGVFFGLLADRALDPPVERARLFLEGALGDLLRAGA